MSYLLYAIPMGVGATIIMDLWGIIRSRLFAMSLPDYRLVGRWIAHMRNGQFCHRNMNAVPATSKETFIGWAAHYIIGVFFAAILLCFSGQAWLQAPTLFPALSFGIISVAAPFLLMQPCMGAGIAASRTPNPTHSRLHSLATHAIFGLGLYISGLVIG